MSYEQIAIRRTCEAIQIPNGNTVTIEEGTLAIITQALGGHVHGPGAGDGRAVPGRRP